jgi:hypothetical protein
MYLVTRLDGGSEQATLDLVARSTSKQPINPYLGWVVLDQDGATGYYVDAIVRNLLYDLSFCVHFDSTLEFRHGPGDPAFNATSDGPYTAAFSTIFIATTGKHHSTSLETITPRYAEYFNPHPAGVFWSLESFNGWELHSPVTGSNGNGVGQGNGLDWLASGGSFAFVHVDEPGAFGAALSGRFVRAYFSLGLTFAEAAYISIPLLARNTAIGDPLARAVIWNPDVNNDHRVDTIDRTLVAARDPSADINGDGVVDAADDAIINATPDRDCSISPAPSAPGTPVPPDESGNFSFRCHGDVNLDLYVDFDDLSILLGAQGSVCPAADVNGSGLVDFADINMMLTYYGAYWPDVDDSGVLDCVDAQTVLNSVGLTSSDPGFDPRVDMNCDGLIDCTDWQIVAVLADGLSMCGQSCP